LLVRGARAGAASGRTTCSRPAPRRVHQRGRRRRHRPLCSHPRESHHAIAVASAERAGPGPRQRAEWELARGGRRRRRGPRARPARAGACPSAGGPPGRPAGARASRGRMPDGRRRMGRAMATSTGGRGARRREGRARAVGAAAICAGRCVVGHGIGIGPDREISISLMEFLAGSSSPRALRLQSTYC